MKTCGNCQSGKDKEDSRTESHDKYYVVSLQVSVSNILWMNNLQCHAHIMYILGGFTWWLCFFAEAPTWSVFHYQVNVLSVMEVAVHLWWAWTNAAAPRTFSEKGRATAIFVEGKACACHVPWKGDGDHYGGRACLPWKGGNSAEPRALQETMSPIFTMKY